MQNRRRVRNVGGTAAAALLVGCLALYGCTGEQYEKPEKKEEPTPEPTEPPAAPTEPPAAEEKAPPAEAEPAAEEAPAAPAEGGQVAAVPEAAEEAEPPAEEAEEEEEAGAESSGGLALLGIVRAGGQTPAALIEYQGSQEIFRRGDSVFGQGTLGEVRGDSVVIKTEDGKMTLGIPASEAEAPPPTPEPLAVEAARPDAAEPAPPPVAQSIPRTEAQAAMRSLSEVFEKAGAERVSVGGGHGIRLGEVGPESFFAKLGLKSGDVLQKINGVALNDLGKLPDLSGAANGAELMVTFVRDEIGLTFSRKLR